MKILILSRYSSLGASSRVRMMQYIPYLRAGGFEVEVASYFDDGYLRMFYSEGRRSGVLRYWARRLSRLRDGTNADLIWLEKEALPWLPWAIERAFLPRNVPVVSDYDDAVFHRYDMHRSRIVRVLLGHKIDRVMANSALVLCGNDYLAARAIQAGANLVEAVPAVVDAKAYGFRSTLARTGQPRIGWIGTPETWLNFVQPMMPLLVQTAKHAAATLLYVGGAPQAASWDVTELVDWCEETEVALLQGMDIGIMPLPDTPWARGKCGYKLIQYMACGLPVVASPVGVNRQIVEHGVNGFLAETEEEWRTALETLLADPDLRQRMGIAGRSKVEAEYSIQVHGPRVARMLRDLVKGRRKGVVR